jgi:hypothetical protein
MRPAQRSCGEGGRDVGGETREAGREGVDRERSCRLGFGDAKRSAAGWAKPTPRGKRSAQRRGRVRAGRARALPEGARRASGATSARTVPGPAAKSPSRPPAGHSVPLQGDPPTRTSIIARASFKRWENRSSVGRACRWSMSKRPPPRRHAGARPSGLLERTIQPLGSRGARVVRRAPSTRLPLQAFTPGGRVCRLPISATRKGLACSGNSQFLWDCCHRPPKRRHHAFTTSLNCAS